ncbi:MAG TPA: hypothetical protein P5200_10230 [Tenuifilaceae bacterium]|nr:hypothetical protein [Tenuifilaceae bacterium]HPQ34089.1 hypothetical protein [Tenuifilaceae bacterium]HRX68740.1 hypothetical protein [Tenuifilaceae bacterium]
MANIRDIKKDINSMIEHFIQECYTHLTFSPPLHQENVLDIISDAVVLKRETIQKVNNPPALSDRKQVRQHYKKIIGDFYDSVVDLTERLNTLQY